MSASHNGSSAPAATATPAPSTTQPAQMQTGDWGTDPFSFGYGVPAPQMVAQVDKLSPLGSNNAGWLNELKNLGYTPNGRSDWGTIGQTVMVPQSVSDSGAASTQPANISEWAMLFPNSGMFKTSGSQGAPK